MGETNMMPNKQVILRSYIQGCPKESDFELRTSEISTEIRDHGSSKSTGVLLKNLYLACDPYMCHLMRPRDIKYMFLQSANTALGSVVRGYGVAKVIKSGYDDDGELKEGDYVWGITGWEDYSWNFEPQKLLTKIAKTDDDVPLSYYAGMPGLAAYVGWNEMCGAKQGETVYVSSAAGGVGHLVGQFAKMLGCYVVGSASTNEKVNQLKTKLGFDNAFNYKEGDLHSNLNTHFPKGVDIYFDNVGGEMLDEVLNKMNINGRIVVCGMISQYNLIQPKGIKNLFNVIAKRLSLRGFIEPDYKNAYPEYAEWVVKKLNEKKLVYVEEVIPGLENAASAFVGMFHGHNTGKRVVVVGGC